MGYREQRGSFDDVSIALYDTSEEGIDSKYAQFIDVFTVTRAPTQGTGWLEAVAKDGVAVTKGGTYAVRINSTSEMYFLFTREPLGYSQFAEFSGELRDSSYDGLGIHVDDELIPAIEIRGLLGRDAGCQHVCQIPRIGLDATLAKPSDELQLQPGVTLLQPVTPGETFVLDSLQVRLRIPPNNPDPNYDLDVVLYEKTDNNQAGGRVCSLEPDNSTVFAAGAADVPDPFYTLHIFRPSKLCTLDSKKDFLLGFYNDNEVDIVFYYGEQLKLGSPLRNGVIFYNGRNYAEPVEPDMHLSVELYSVCEGSDPPTNPPSSPPPNTPTPPGSTPTPPGSTPTPAPPVCRGRNSVADTLTYLNEVGLDLDEDPTRRISVANGDWVQQSVKVDLAGKQLYSVHVPVIPKMGTDNVAVSIRGAVRVQLVQHDDTDQGAVVSELVENPIEASAPYGVVEFVDPAETPLWVGDFSIRIISEAAYGVDLPTVAQSLDQFGYPDNNRGTQESARQQVALAVHPISDDCLEACTFDGAMVGSYDAQPLVPEVAALLGTGAGPTIQSFKAEHSFPLSAISVRGSTSGFSLDMFGHVGPIVAKFGSNFSSTTGLVEGVTLVPSGYPLRNSSTTFHFRMPGAPARLEQGTTYYVLLEVSSWTESSNVHVRRADIGTIDNPAVELGSMFRGVAGNSWVTATDPSPMAMSLYGKCIQEEETYTASTTAASTSAGTGSSAVTSSQSTQAPSTGNERTVEVSGVIINMTLAGNFDDFDEDKFITGVEKFLGIEGSDRLRVYNARAGSVLLELFILDHPDDANDDSVPSSDDLADKLTDEDSWDELDGYIPPFQVDEMGEPRPETREVSNLALATGSGDDDGGSDGVGTVVIIVVIAILVALLGVAIALHVRRRGAAGRAGGAQEAGRATELTSSAPSLYAAPDNLRKTGGKQSAGRITSSDSTYAPPAELRPRSTLGRQRSKRGTENSSLTGNNTTNTMSSTGTAYPHTMGTMSSVGTGELERKYIIAAADLEKGKRIGAGGYGYVYKGEWRSITVAIKEVRGDDADVKEMLMREAQAAVDLRPHQNIVTLYGVCMEPFSIVTAFCEQGSLDEMLFGDRRREFTSAEKKQLCTGIASGVQHLHMEGIIHRDLAARNVLVSASGTPMVADFGMSRKDETGGRDDNSTATSVGPIKWMAPEQLESQLYSTASDVWSFGVVLFEVTAQQLPWKGVSNMKAAQLVLCGKHLAMPEYAPKQAPPAVLKAMRACFALGPRDRPSMGWVVKKLSKDWDAPDGGPDYNPQGSRRSRRSSIRVSNNADDIYDVPTSTGNTMRRGRAGSRLAGTAEERAYSEPPPQ